MFDQPMLTTRCHGETINVACLLSPIEVARQCTLVDHQLFCQIKMEECLSKKRTKKVKEISRKYIYIYIFLFSSKAYFEIMTF